MNRSSPDFKYFCDSIIPSQSSGLPSLYEIIYESAESIETNNLINSFICLFDNVYESFLSESDENRLLINQLRAPLRRQFLEKALIIYCSHSEVQRFIYSVRDPIGTTERQL